jgi:hypothetical protein
VRRIANPKYVLGTAVLILLVLYFSKDDIHSVAVRTWNLAETGVDQFPELDDSKLAISELRDRPSFGIAFSGGGTRSATASLGELRALHKLGWLPLARHISANSGGSWAAVPYTYLPSSIDDESFLGSYVPPDALNDQTLKPATPDPSALGTAIHNASTIDKILELGRGDEAYADIVGSIFLKPFGLDDNEKFFTFHAAALKENLAGNPNLSADDFYIVEKLNRPYLIVTGVMIAQQRSSDSKEYFPIEMTPVYTGVRARFEFEKDEETVVVGGGYVESFGYDSYEPGGGMVDDRWTVRLSGLLGRGDKPIGDRYRFTLADVIGTSSAAPLATLSRYSIPNIAFPEFRHWPIDRESIEQSGEHVRRRADEFQHGDGGDIDNLAIMPLLVRKTENIIAFINSSHAFESPPAGCQDISEDYITDDVISLFRKSELLVHNIVFPNGEAQLIELCEKLSARKERQQPLVHCQPYDVIQNARHRIEPYRASICWVYLDRVGAWFDKINPDAGDLNRQLHDRSGSFNNFPHYSTFAEHGVALIDLDPERVNALSNLTAWVVLEMAEYIANNLPGASLPIPEIDMDQTEASQLD